MYQIVVCGLAMSTQPGHWKPNSANIVVSPKEYLLYLQKGDDAQTRKRDLYGSLSMRRESFHAKGPTQQLDAHATLDVSSCRSFAAHRLYIQDPAAAAAFETRLSQFFLCSINISE
jgi:hypothetical protein